MWVCFVFRGKFVSQGITDQERRQDKLVDFAHLTF
jgi:hypothetical protein